jgi:hypothetical protein
MTEHTPANFLREYLSRMADIRGTGAATKETSYYSALENLLNQIGKTLKPQVICNGQLRNQGADNPDFGLYTRGQVQRGEPVKGQPPERGVIEVKGLAILGSPPKERRSPNTSAIIDWFLSRTTVNSD